MKLHFEKATLACVNCGGRESRSPQAVVGLIRYITEAEILSTMEPAINLQTELLIRTNIFESCIEDTIMAEHLVGASIVMDLLKLIQVRLDIKNSYIPIKLQ